MEVKEIKLSEIEISALNTRKDLQAGMEDSSIDDLANSIKEKGLLSPITVKRNEDGKYGIIVGQRRFLACKKLGKETISAIIRKNIDETDATILSLVENIHRADMSPLDKATALKKIYDTYSDYEKVEKESGISVQTIKKYLKLLSLSDSMQDKLTTSDGPSGINALSKLAETFKPEDQERVFNEIKGFKQDIQLQIIKKSGGDVGKISLLKESALEGHFDTHLCHGIEECIFIPKESIEAVKNLIKDTDFGIDDSYIKTLPTNIKNYVIEAVRCYQNNAYTACCSMLGNVLMDLIENECKRTGIELNKEELDKLRSERKNIFEEKLLRLEIKWDKEKKEIKKLHKTLLEVGKIYRDFSDHPTGKVYEESDAKLFMNTLLVVMKELFKK